MSELLKATRFTPPITTGSITTGSVGGTPSVRQQEVPAGQDHQFLQVLTRTLSEGTAVEFSKHAVSRVAQRNIDVSETSLQRLEQGVRLAQEKGLRETMILIDKTAFIVSVQNNKVITTVEGDELQGSVFTNIDGAVIM